MKRGSYLVSVPVILILAATVICAASMCMANESSDLIPKPAVAQVLEFSGPIGVNRPDINFAYPDMYLFEEDTLTIPKDVYVTLLFRKGTIARFDGQATLAIPVGKNEGIPIIGKITKALLSILFTRRREDDEEVRLAVRGIIDGRMQPMRVPKLLFPPSGSALTASPVKLEWQEIEGVFNYSVCLYDNDGLVWRGKANSGSIVLPTDRVSIEPGIEYIWIVETSEDKHTLRSRQSKFVVLESGIQAEIQQYIGEIEKSIQDPRLLHLLKARVYREQKLKIECYKELECLLEENPDDYTALLSMAALMDEMGLDREALRIYRDLVNRKAID